MVRFTRREIIFERGLVSHKNLDRICENNRGINRKVDSQQLEYIVTAVPGTSIYYSPLGTGV